MQATWKTLERKPIFKILKFTAMLTKPAHDFTAGLMSAVNGIVRTKVTGVKKTHKNVLIVK